MVMFNLFAGTNCRFIQLQVFVARHYPHLQISVAMEIESILIAVIAKNEWT